MRRESEGHKAQMNIKFDRIKRILNVAPEGEIDQSSAKSMRSTIDREITKRRELRKMVLDLKNVSFMDSSGIGLILGRYKLLASLGATLDIINASPGVEKVIRIAGVRALIEQQYDGE